MASGLGDCAPEKAIAGLCYSGIPDKLSTFVVQLSEGHHWEVGPVDANATLYKVEGGIGTYPYRKSHHPRLRYPLRLDASSWSS